MDCPIQHIPSRIGLPSARGRQVSAALGKVHSQQAAAPRMNTMPLPALYYEAYEALQVRVAIWNCGYMAAPALCAASRAAGALSEAGTPRRFEVLSYSGRTVSISNVSCFIQKCLLDNAINKGVDFVASFRYLWIVRNDDYRFPDCVEFLKEAHHIAGCFCIQRPCRFIRQ